mgnify:CR=1 FL=1
MFSFFKKKKVEQNETSQDQDFVLEPEENCSVSIRFFIKENESNPTVDVEIRDYEDKTTDDLCRLVVALGTDQLYIETIEMIKNGLLEDSKSETLLKLALHIGDTLSKKQKSVEKTKETPCIKPSDML